MTNTRIICLYPDSTQTVLFDTDIRSTHWLTKATLSLSEDAAGKFVFTFLPQHTVARNVRLMGSEIQVMINRRVIFSGRPITVDEDMDRRTTVTCEGNLNWALDVPDLFTNPITLIYDYYVYNQSGGPSTLARLLFTAETVEEVPKNGGAAETKYTGVYTHTWAAGEVHKTFGSADEGEEFEFMYMLPHLVKITSNVEGEPDVTTIETDGSGNMVYDGLITEKTTCERYLDTYDTWWEYIGNPGLHSDALSGRTANGSANVFTGPFTVEPGAAGFILLRCPEHANAKLNEIYVHMRVRKRKKLPVSDMFYLMFPRFTDSNTTNYNGYCSPHRKLYGGNCDIEGELAYEPAFGASCLDTLREWQKSFGGYVYTRLAPYNGFYEWTVNYTKEPGEEDEGAAFELGDNIIDISVKENAENVVTEIRGVGKDDRTGEEFTLEMNTVAADFYGYYSQGMFYTDPDCTKMAYLSDGATYYDIFTGTLYAFTELSFVETSASGSAEFDEFLNASTDAEGVTLMDYDANKFPVTGAGSYRTSGFVRSAEYAGAHGQILAVRRYDIKHLAGNKAAMRRILYGKIVEDLQASVKEAESVSVTTIDPRLLGVSDTDIHVGNSYRVKSRPHGIDRYMELSGMELDLLFPQNSKLTFGEKRPLISEK